MTLWHPLWSALPDYSHWREERSALRGRGGGVKHPWDPESWIRDTGSCLTLFLSLLLFLFSFLLFTCYCVKKRGSVFLSRLTPETDKDTSAHTHTIHTHISADLSLEMDNTVSGVHHHTHRYSALTFAVRSQQSALASLAPACKTTSVTDDQWTLLHLSLSNPQLKSNVLWLASLNALNVHLISDIYI